MSAAAGTSTITVAVSSAVIAGAAPGTFATAVCTTAMVASPAPSGVSVIAGFRDSERTLKMRQEGVTDMKMDDCRTKHGAHGSRDQNGRLSARQGRYLTLALIRLRH